MLDCIEIDGASNNGVENVRELIEKARFEPNQWAYKVYIIDEVHMLSTGAFNALLKILEEPPAHVKFVLATTEIEKVPETIRSRSLRFDFRKITEADIIARLQYIAQTEGITVEDEALRIIAKAARGWLRDALTLLEQNIIDREVRSDHVRYTLALVDDTLVDTLIEAFRLEDVSKVLEILETLRSGHIDARGLFEQILYRLRDLLFEYIDDARFGSYQTIFTLIMEGHSKIRTIPDGMMLVEITFLKVVKRGSTENTNMRLSVDSRGTAKKNDNTKSQGDSTDEALWGEKKNAKWEEMSFSTTDAFGTLTSQGGTGGNKSTEIGSWKVQKDSTNLDSEYPRVASLLTSSEFTFTSSEWQITEENGLLHKTLNDVNLRSPWKTTEEPRTKNQEPRTDTSFSFPALISHFRETNLPLMTDLKTARFQTDGIKLTLIFSKSWNHGRVDTPKVRNLICEWLTKLFGWDWTVECRLDAGIWVLNVDEVF